VENWILLVGGLYGDELRNWESCDIEIGGISPRANDGLGNE